MENLNFVQNVLIFLALNAVGLLTLNVKNVGKYISFGATLLAALVFFGMLFSQEVFTLSELFSLEGNKILLLKIVSIMNVFMILINGYHSLEKVKNSILMSYMFMGGVFLLGANDLMTFYVALETVALVGYALVATSDLENSREAAVKYLIQGSIISAIFLLGVAFYLGATNGLTLVGATVVNQEFYAIALGIFILTACFKLGAFPFHAWIADVYSNVTRGNLATNFFISKIIIGFKFITLLQLLLLECDPHFQDILIRIVQVIAVMSAFYGNIMAVVQGQFKRVIAYSSVAHTGYMLMMICLNPDEAYEKQLIAYLVVYSLTATGIILILNQFAELNKNRDGRDILKAGFYRNKGLSVMLVIFVLSLAGIPLTSGFAMKYMLFTNFFREGFTIEATSIFISTIIGFAYYIRFVSDLFTEDESKMSLPTIKTRFSESLVHVIILVSIFTIGIAPSLFLGLK
ncbi:proton-conducting transporter membrane subunit [Bacteriovorax sp. PP10]|jgi:NADH-quinone oxidoreductase subunit N|uniref:Proton-conducting transporter membrane subunit n=1 Tax=Bacteriovorax antarcticus TaxID=3088717 RepID=A0ABU5VNY5_9BACT|nr:proton-conducting transporter membrane subunit [Bacteriovorax sp. PP10]MEA9354760.1 proton-conducting transporter membrane subunit [Bacteriovorax sp. PP10]